MRPRSVVHHPQSFPPGVGQQVTDKLHKRAFAQDSTDMRVRAACQRRDGPMPLGMLLSRGTLGDVVEQTQCAVSVGCRRTVASSDPDHA
jgi:hypothetical protein